MEVGDRGGTLWNKGGIRWDAKENGVGCRNHAREEAGRRMRDIKFFIDFLVCFLAKYQKSEPKNIDYFLF